MFEFVLISAGLAGFFYIIREPHKWRGPSYFLSARYKRYASWPVVLFCRKRSHEGQGVWHSETITRCIGVGWLIGACSPKDR